MKNISYTILILSFFTFQTLKAEIFNFNHLYDSIQNDILYRYFEYNDFSFSDIDKEQIQKLYELNSIDNNLVNKAKIQYLDALILHSDPVPDSGKIISLIDEALNTFTKQKYPKEYAKLIMLKATVYTYSTYRYIEAYHLFNEALNLLAQEKDIKFLGLTYFYLAVLWSYLSEWESALENMNKSEEIFKEAGLENTAFFVRLNKSNILARMGNYKEVIPSMKRDLSHAKEKNDTASGIFLNAILGSCYISMDELDSASTYLNKALIFCNEHSSPSLRRQAVILYYLGRLFYQKGDYGQAQHYLESSLPMMLQLKLAGAEGGVRSLLGDIYKKNGEIEKAYKYLEYSINIRDSLAISEKASELQRLKGHSELMNYQQQIKINEQKSEIKQTRFVLIIVLLLFTLVIILFILHYLNKDKQLKDLKIIQLDQQLRNEEMNNRLEKMEMEKQMEEKEREIATTHLLIEEKGKVFDLLVKIFKPLYETKEISPKAWRELQQFISSNTRKENDWEKSKIHFDKVHPDFFKKLREVAPDMTENELRLSAYIKIGMRTKQIAEMLSIDQRSVITNRYHLKKKLNLPKEQNLDQFIRDI